MPRPALAATRSAAILNFLAANPSEGFTLSDLAERLGINVASMHALLGALTDAGYLARHPRLRTYTLGPSGRTLGTARARTPIRPSTSPQHTHNLAHETGLEVAVTTVAGDHIIFLARAGDPYTTAVPVHVGQHVPFVPPLGSVLTRWGDANRGSLEPTTPTRSDPSSTPCGAAGLLRAALEADAPRAPRPRAYDDLASGPVRRPVTRHGRRDRRPRPRNTTAGCRDLDPTQLVRRLDDRRTHLGPAGEVTLAFTLLGFGAASRAPRSPPTASTSATSPSSSPNAPAAAFPVTRFVLTRVTQ